MNLVWFFLICLLSFTAQASLEANNLQQSFVLGHRPEHLFGSELKCQYTDLDEANYSYSVELTIGSNGQLRGSLQKDGRMILDPFLSGLNFVFTRLELTATQVLGSTQNNHPILPFHPTHIFATVRQIKSRYLIELGMLPTLNANYFPSPISSMPLGVELLGYFDCVSKIK